LELSLKVVQLSYSSSEEQALVLRADQHTVLLEAKLHALLWTDQRSLLHKARLCALFRHGVVAWWMVKLHTGDEQKGT